MKSEIGYLIFALLSKEKSRLVSVLQRGSDVTEAMELIPAVAMREPGTPYEQVVRPYQDTLHSFIRRDNLDTPSPHNMHDF